MMHYGSYHTDDPAADAGRYFDDLEDTYPEKDYIVEMSYRLFVRVTERGEEEARNMGNIVANEILREIKDDRMIDTEWLETTDVEEE